MAERVILVNESRFSGVGRFRFFMNEGMVGDLVTATSLPSDKIDSLITALENAQGFLSPKRLGLLIRETVGSGDKADAVFRVLRNLRANDLDELIDRLKDWRSEDEQNTKFLPEDAFVKVQDCLRKLLKRYPALDRYRKAERLEDITGRSLEEVEIICDLRPIFDEKREKIEGMMPYTRLKLVVEGDDSNSVSMEAELSAAQVRELAEKAQKAEKKLECLRKYVQEWNPEGLPDTSRVRMPQTKGDGNE